MERRKRSIIATTLFLFGFVLLIPAGYALQNDPFLSNTPPLALGIIMVFGSAFVFGSLFLELFFRKEDAENWADEETDRRLDAEAREEMEEKKKEAEAQKVHDLREKLRTEERQKEEAGDRIEKLRRSLEREKEEVEEYKALWSEGEIQRRNLAEKLNALDELFRIQYNDPESGHVKYLDTEDLIGPRFFEIRDKLKEKKGDK